MSKFSIGIGIKINDIKTVKQDLNKQLNNIKGVNVKISNFEFDEKITDKIQSKFNTLTKKLKFKINGVEVDEKSIERVTNQLQTQLNKLSKETNIKLGNVEVKDSIKTKVQSQLNQVLKDVVIRIKDFDVDTSKIENTIKNTNLKSSSNVFDSNQIESIKKRVDDIKASSGELAKVNYFANPQGDLEKAVISYNNRLGQSITETVGWRRVVNETTNEISKEFGLIGTKITDNVEKTNQLSQTIQNVKGKMNEQTGSLKSFGFDGNVLKNLQNDINSLSVKSLPKEIESVQNRINALSKDGVKNITTLQNAINSITSRINNTKIQKQDVIDKNELNELKYAEENVQKLQSLLKNVKSGKVIDGRVISTEVNVARNSVNNLNQAIKQVEIGGEKVNSFFKNLASYTFGVSGLYFALNQFKDGLNSIKEIDTALRDLKRVVDDVQDGISDKQLDSFPVKANEVAKSLGTTTEEAIRATTVWKQMGFSFNEASTFLAKQSLILGNVGDMKSDDATNSLVSTLKAFKLESKDAVPIVDSLNEAGNKFAVTTGDMAEGLRIGASSMALANNDLYQTQALLVAGTEVLRDPNSVGNGLKTISMRLNQIKTKGGETFYKMNQSLQDVGVNLLDANGNLRSTYDVVVDLSKVWNSGMLNDMTKSNILDSVAGKHQAKVLSSILQNSQQLEKAYNTLSNSAGSAMREQEKYIQSIEGRLNAFKETTKSLFINSIDTSFVKTLLEGATSVIGVFDSLIKNIGILPTAIGTATVAMGMFNNEFKKSIEVYKPESFKRIATALNEQREAYAKTGMEIKRNMSAQRSAISMYEKSGTSTLKLKAGLLGYQTQLGITAVKSMACAVATTALQVAFSMGLSLAITAVVTGITKFADSIINAKGVMDNCAESAKTFMGSLEQKDSNNKLFRQYEELNGKLKDGNLTLKQREEIQKQIKSVANQLKSSDSDFGRILDNNNKKYEERLTLMKAIENKKLNKEADELKDDMPKNGIVKNLYDGNAYAAGKPQNLVGMIKSYKELNDLVTNSNIDEKIKIGNATYSFEKAKSKLDELKDSMVDSYTTIGTWNTNVEALGEVGKAGDLSMIELDEGTKAFMNSLLGVSSSVDPAISKLDLINKSVNEFGVRGKVSQNTINELANAFPNLGVNISNVNGIISEFRQRIQDNSNTLRSIQSEIDTTGSVSQESISKLSTIFPELGINAGNAKDVVSGFGGELDSLETQAEETATALKKVSDEFDMFGGEADAIDKVKKEMKDYGGITRETYSNLMKSFPDVLAALGSEGNLYNNLEALKKRDMTLMEDRRKEAIRTATEEFAVKNGFMNSEGKSFAQLCDEKAKNDAIFNKNAQTNSSNTEKQHGENYNGDNKNFTSGANGKLKTDSGFNNNVRQHMAGTVNNLGGMYKTDVSNFQKSVNAKNRMLTAFKSKFANMANAKTLAEGIGVPLDAKLNQPWNKDLRDATGKLIGADINAMYNEEVNGLKDNFRNIANSIDDSDIPLVDFDAINASPTSVSSSDIGGGGSKGGSGGGSGGSDGKSDAEKEAERIAKEIEQYKEKIDGLYSNLDLDNYFQMNESLTILENKLSQLKVSQEGLLGKDLVDMKRKEVDVINEQIQAYTSLMLSQQTEMYQLQSILKVSGMNFDADNRLISANEILGAKQQEINQRTYESSEAGYQQKQNDIDALKRLQDEVKRYSTLTTSELPKAQQKWDELSNSIRKIQMDNLKNLKEELAKGIQKEQEKEQETKLKKIDDNYDRRKKRLEAEYKEDVESIKSEKESQIKFYDEQIKTIQKQLDDLNDDTDDKKNKLEELRRQKSLWEKDDSVFASKQIQDLQKQIAELEKDLLKDSLKNQIDDLNDKKKKDEEYYDGELEDLKNSHDEEIKEMEDKHKKERERKEKHYKDMLKDKEIYAKADELITSNNVKEMLRILEDSSESFKEVGTLLGVNFREALEAEISNGVEDFKSLKEDYSQKHNSNKNSGASSKRNYKEWYDEKGYLHMEGDIPIHYNDEQKNIQRFDTGGRISGSVNKNGALAILDRKEKVLNEKDNNMLDRIFDYVKMTSSNANILDKLNSKNNLGKDFDLQNGVNQITKYGNQVSSTNENKEISIKNSFDIKNYNNSDSAFSKREIERWTKHELNRFK